MTNSDDASLIARFMPPFILAITIDAIRMRPAAGPYRAFTPPQEHDAGAAAYAALFSALLMPANITRFDTIKRR